MRNYLKQIFDIKFGKFVVVGMINTLAGAALMFGLYNLAGCSYWLSSAVNYVLTSILSFALNWHFTFQYTGKLIPVVFRFVGNIVFCYVVAYGLAKPVVLFLLQSFSVSVQENFAMVLGMCLFTGLNYFGQRFFVFRSSEKEEIGGE